MSKIINTSICFSGQLRGFENNVENLYENLFKFIPEYNLFFSIYKDTESISFYEKNKHNKNMFIELIDENNVVNNTCCKSYGLIGPESTDILSRYFKQIYSLFRVKELVNTISKSHDIIYNNLIRCRTDIKFINKIDYINYESIGESIIVPSFHSFNGYNDRFAIGNKNLMEIYFNILNDIDRQCKNGFRLHAESTLREVLLFNNISVVEDDRIKFRRVRDFGLIDDEII